MKLTSLGIITLLSLSFLVGISSQSTYDIWYDFDDDGDIDIFDIVDIAGRYGTTGTPLNKTAILLELQARMETTETKFLQVKTLRFLEPNETIHNDANSNTWIYAASFVWTPNNSTDNAILAVYGYFQHLNPQYHIQTEVRINNVNLYGLYVAGADTYEWIKLWYENSGSLPTPNQQNYTITFRFNREYLPFAYVKNINIIIEVIDGLPPIN